MIPVVYADDGVNISQQWRLAFFPQFQSIGGLVGYFLKLALLAGGIFAFVLVILAGIGVIMAASSGDSHAMENRRMILTYSLVGLLIMFGSYWIIQILNYISGGAFGGVL